MKHHLKNLGLGMMLLILLAGLLTGCTSQETTTSTEPAGSTSSPYTEQQLRQMLTDSVKNVTEATGYKAEMAMLMDFDAGETSDFNGASTDLRADLVVDNAGKNLKMDMSMAIDAQDVSEQMDMVFIVMQDYLYMYMDVPGMGSQWLKIPATPEVLESMDIEAMYEEMEVLASPETIEYVRTEPVGGEECIVLKITPNIEYLENYAREQQPEGVDFDWEALGDVTDLYKDIDCHVWLITDSLFVAKMDMTMTIDFSSVAADTNNPDYKQLIAVISSSITYSDYNEPVSIELPPEAADAMEMPAEAFIN